METKSQKKNHVVIVTSDAQDATVKQFRMKSWLVWGIIIVICAIIGALIGYIAYEERIWNAAAQKIEEQNGQIKLLEENNSSLQTEIEGLNNKITVLSDTIKQMQVTEEELEAQIGRFASPTLLPITGSATIEEVTEGDFMNIFTAAEGAVVVSTASGVVAEVGEDADYGHRVVIDHGNGYKTIYRNAGTPLAATGDSVAQGGTLFIINEDNTKLGYQITKDDVYVNPSEMMEIKG